ncbi:uncharacterized protein STEHIDRAFT_156710 [Stereum hirsutum FP-91666 SS1]|uniref:uncharacterized protein n=1 Tax=Stereum hirsutum (strain FP-91666) TaxID=721885 RepID=UPI000440AA1A|nr:uncharacterized protein STEHIDRAFT_156710 [Stereum hirsutum FP-91666 SS1]EIM86388.1 hypothetical protein STEHIDRAFT_156710 [Stereum hirsutum FP-91666 SS1]
MSPSALITISSGYPTDRHVSHGYTVDTAHLLISTLTITRFLNHVSSGEIDPNNESSVYAALWADTNELADVSHLSEVQGSQIDMDTCTRVVGSIFRDAGFHCSTIAGYIGDEVLRHSDIVRTGLVIGLWPINAQAMVGEEYGSPESIRVEGRKDGKQRQAQAMIGWISVDSLGVKRLKLLEWRTESKRSTESSRQGLKVYEHDPKEFEILRLFVFFRDGKHILQAACQIPSLALRRSRQQITHLAASTFAVSTTYYDPRSSAPTGHIFTSTGYPASSHTTTPREYHSAKEFALSSPFIVQHFEI